MSFDFIKYRETKGLYPVKVPNKVKYYTDLLNLEESWTGRIGAEISNTFILESVQLIINSIVQFEIGYFDSAFYSLRQSLELSTTMTFLVDNDRESKEKELKKWKEQSRFPMYGQMLKILEERETVYSDIKEKMSEYFQDIKDIKTKLNKVVHKQGFNTFYVSKNHPINQEKSRDKFINKYEFYLEKCIGAIAVFRLTIDPFPILLNDPEIYIRTDQTITRGYDDNFISTYIGSRNIEKYKQTKLYCQHYEFLMTQEAKNEFATYVVKDNYIDIKYIDEIMKQKHLLSEYGFYSVLLSAISDKISKISCLGGLHWYITSTRSNRINQSGSTRDFKKYEDSTENFNMAFEEVFASTIEIGEECYLLEHNLKFSKEEILKIEEVRSTSYNIG